MPSGREFNLHSDEPGRFHLYGLPMSPVPRRADEQLAPTGRESEAKPSFSVDPRAYVAESIQAHVHRRCRNRLMRAGIDHCPLNAPADLRLDRDRGEEPHQQERNDAHL